MTNSEWIVMGGYLLTLLGAVLLAYRKLDAASDTAKEAKDAANKLRDDVSTINAKLTEISYVHRAVEKHDDRIIRLENHILNL